MRNRRKYVLLLAIALVVVLVLLAFIPSREPSYGGKKLSEWVAGYDDVLTAPPYSNPNITVVVQNEAAADAIRHIGTNALPYLLEWISYEPPSWKVRFFDIWEKFPGRGGEPWWERDKKMALASQTIKAFRALGPDAHAAIPQLGRLLNEPKWNGSGENWSAGRAADALGYLGKDSLPALVRALTNSQVAAGYAPVVQAIERLRTNADPDVQQVATNALRKIDPKALE